MRIVVRKFSLLFWSYRVSIDDNMRCEGLLGNGWQLDGEGKSGDELKLGREGVSHINAHSI